MEEVIVVPDFPEPGISFTDLSGIVADPQTLAMVVRSWIELIGPERPTVIVGIEARGSPLGATLAFELGCGFVALRKPGKLTRETQGQEHSREYGTSAADKEGNWRRSDTKETALARSSPRLWRM